jgi:hypothetical membrane protein
VDYLSEHRESFWVRWGGVAGIATPAFAFTFIGLAIVTYPEFSWVNNALSDLGVVPDITSALFNYGLLVSGLFSLNFAIGLFKFLDKHIVGKVGAIIFFLAGLSLEGIGFFPENIRPFHYVFSVAFFILMPIAMLVVVGYFLVARQKGLSIFTLLAALVAAAPWILYFLVRYAPGVAIPELISALAGSAWAVVIGWKMFRSASFPQKTDSRP